MTNSTSNKSLISSLSNDIMHMAEIYKTNRGWSPRSITNASVNPHINLRAGPVGPLEG